MIRNSDSITLARTKLRSRRLLLAGSILTAGLLFSAIFASVMVFEGASRSVQDYTQAALRGKYLVRSTPVLPQDIIPSTTDLSAKTIAELNALQDKYISRQRTIADELDISFNEESITPILIPNPYANKNLPEKQRVMINNESPIYDLYLQNLQKEYVKVADNKYSDLKKLAKPYGAISYHKNIRGQVNYTNMTLLMDGEENVEEIGENDGPQNSNLTTYGYLTHSVRNSMYTFVDDSIIQRLILPANAKREATNDAIPVVITTQEAVDLFGEKLHIPEKPEGFSEQVKWMRSLREKVNGQIYTTCYRNQAELSLISRTVQTAQEIKSNDTNENYVKPPLIYNLPKENCGSITVKEDNRTPQQKRTAENQILASKKLGRYVEPKHQLFKFQIVGLMSASPQQESMQDVTGFISNLFGGKYGTGALIPTQLYNQLPDNVRHENILLATENSRFDDKALQEEGIGEMVIAFPSAATARNFIENEGCPVQDNCDRPFVLETYGANYLLADDLSTTILRILHISLLVVVSIATIIVSLVMSRVISEGRRETAVFRAIGAKRGDITKIYLYYSIGVAFRIVVFSFLLGLTAAIALQIGFGNQLTDYANISYGIYGSAHFKLISLKSFLLILIAACIISVSLIAIVPPLIRNVRRNPIRDMRDE